MSDIHISNEEIYNLNQTNTNDLKYNSILYKIDKQIEITPEDLNRLATLLIPDGNLEISIKPFENHIDFGEELKINMKFGGFKSISIRQDNECLIIKGVNKAQTGLGLFSADKNLNINKWNIDINQKNQSELIPESKLINPNDFYENFSKKEDCITKPKPCKNCNCGRANNNTATVDEKSNLNILPKSDCGNCYLGDAFRCDGCPYKGLPAFEPGQKIIFKNEDKDINLNKEEVEIKSKDNKIKIDL